VIYKKSTCNLATIFHNRNYNLILNFKLMTVFFSKNSWKIRKNKQNFSEILNSFKIERDRSCGSKFISQ